MALAPNDMGGTERGNSMRLVTAHRSGDESAFTEIVRAHYPTLLACARRRLANPQDAEDAVQEAFLRAYRRLETFGNEGDWRLGAWLNTILSNVCADILCRRRPTAPFDEWADGQADDRPDAADLVSDTVVHDAIARAIATLPQSQRSAFLLRMVDDRPYDEVAATLGITEDNARARVARARSALQRSLSRSEALTGMLAAAPLFVAGSLRSALRRVFSSSAGDSAHATVATMTSNASAASAEVATVAGGPASTSVQLLGQLASTPVAQVALAASTSGAGRGSVVFGVVASLAAAGGLSVPAVAAVSAPRPSAAAEAAPRLASALTVAPSTSTQSVPLSGTTQAATASTATSPAPAPASTAPADPAWVAVAASAAVNGPAGAAPGTAQGPTGTSSSSGPATGASPGSASGGASSTATPGSGSAGSTSPTGSGAGGSGTAGSGTTTPGTSTGAGLSTLPSGTCATVPGFPQVTAPSSVPALSSDALVAVMSTAAHSFTSAGGAPSFQATGSMSSTTNESVTPVAVTVGTCLAANGSILAVDISGTTGAEVQLVGSLVAAPVLATTGANGTSVEYLFRGEVTQVAGTESSGGRLPWDLSSSFVAEVQVQSDNLAELEVVFLQAIPGTTSPSATSPTSGSTPPGTVQGAATAGTGSSSTATSGSTPGGTSTTKAKGAGTTTGTEGTGSGSGTRPAGTHSIGTTASSRPTSG